MREKVLYQFAAEVAFEGPIGPTKRVSNLKQGLITWFSAKYTKTRSCDSFPDLVSETELVVDGPHVVDWDFGQLVLMGCGVVPQEEVRKN